MSCPILHPLSPQLPEDNDRDDGWDFDIPDRFNPVDDAVRSVKDAQYSVGRGVWNELADRPYMDN